LPPLVVPFIYERHRERRFRVYEEAPGLRPGPRGGIDLLAISALQAKSEL